MLLIERGIGCYARIIGQDQTFSIGSYPKKSTLDDANQQQNAEVFGIIYNKLFIKYGHVFSDSRIKDNINKQIDIFDSTTISLFKNILKYVGRKPKDGKRNCH